MLVAALNPCPCGHLGSALRKCVCSLAGVAAYRARLSGPLLDRIDMHVEVPAQPYRQLARTTGGESSATVRQRVEEARQRQRARGPRCNARLSGAELEALVPLDSDGHTLLERAVDRLALSARAVSRIRRVARTIADLCGEQQVRANHLAEALQYRVLDRSS
jgi:magnesium chelatase family protein